MKERYNDKIRPLFHKTSKNPVRVVVGSQFLAWGTEVLCGMTSGCRFRQAPSTRLRPCPLHDGNYIGQPGEFTAWNSA